MTFILPFVKLLFLIIDGVVVVVGGVDLVVDYWC
jgi:hypothetical protein